MIPILSSSAVIKFVEAIEATVFDFGDPFPDGALRRLRAPFHVEEGGPMEFGHWKRSPTTLTARSEFASGRLDADC
jgi:hypothetical protein